MAEVTRDTIWRTKSTCPHCANPQWYRYDYDSAFCPACNVWLNSEPAPGSGFEGRPDTPMRPRSDNDPDLSDPINDLWR